MTNNLTDSFSAEQDKILKILVEATKEHWKTALDMEYLKEIAGRLALIRRDLLDYRAKNDELGIKECEERKESLLASLTIRDFGKKIAISNTWKNHVLTALKTVIRVILSSVFT